VPLLIGATGPSATISGMNATTTVGAAAASELAVAAAWQRYLVDVHDAAACEYDRVEQEAWLRLKRRLRLIGRPLDEP
jgi:hypothetical protein